MAEFCRQQQLNDHSIQNWPAKSVIGNIIAASLGDLQKAGLMAWRRTLKQHAKVAGLPR